MTCPEAASLGAARINLFPCSARAHKRGGEAAGAEEELSATPTGNHEVVSEGDKA